MQNPMEKVQTFHEVFGGHVGKTPTVDLPPETMALRVELLREEVEEYAQAINAGDPVGVADALTNILYVLLFWALMSPTAFSRPRLSCLMKCTAAT